MRSLLLALALLGIAAQEPKELPPGQFCVHLSATNPHPAHPCACKRECTKEEPERVVEDAQCKSYCHADHCHCPVRGCS